MRLQPVGFVAVCFGACIVGCDEPPTDLELIDMMIPHHEMAIQMADQELARGADPRVREMASMIKSAQLQEIAEMRAIRQQLTGDPNPPPASPPDPHAEADMALLMSLSGEDLDEAFLTHMIPHHSMAIINAHRLLPQLRRPDLRRMAIQIFESQADEIPRMQELREALDARPWPTVSAMVIGDLAFIDEMVPHHRMAIEMAEQVIRRGSSRQVRQLARTMKRKQLEEIAIMLAAREKLTGTCEEPPPMPDPHAEENLWLMKHLSGHRLDHVFLVHVIPHHAQAIVISHDALPSLERPELRELAIRIFEDQAREIGEIQRLRESHPWEFSRTVVEHDAHHFSDLTR